MKTVPFTKEQIKEVIKTHPTPFHIYDEEGIRQGARKLREAFSWNEGFKEYFDNVDADFFCIQETKMQKEQATFDMKGYFEYWNCADKKGYSGTLIYTKHKPINVIYGINIDNEEDLATKYNVFSIPCLVIFQNGVEKKRNVGFIPEEELESFIGESHV